MKSLHKFKLAHVNDICTVFFKDLLCKSACERTVYRYKCDKCDKTFCQSGNLKIHIKTVHEGARDYKCDNCGKAFASNNGLNYHIHAAHNEEKNLKCETCGKFFSHINNLKRHITSVHKRSVKNHKCEICDKAFCQLQDLKYHIRSIHEGEKNQDSKKQKKHKHLCYNNKSKSNCKICL